MSLPKVLLLALVFQCLIWVPDSSLGQDFSGVWKGKWTAAATPRLGEHGGALRIKLKKTSSNSYQGTFTGRFALVLPYFYRATVTQQGSHLYSSKKLGPMGEYKMNLRASSDKLAGSWNTKGHRGTIRLRKKR